MSKLIDAIGRAYLAAFEAVSKVPLSTWAVLVALLFVLDSYGSTSRQVGRLCSIVDHANNISRAPLQNRDMKALMQWLQKPEDETSFVGRAVWRWQQIDGKEGAQICGENPDDVSPGSDQDSDPVSPP